MILAAHQPAYLPWLGYFDKIARSDVFVYLDSVQFEKNSFTNRNQIKTPQGPSWLTVPVKSKGHTSSTLAELEIDDTQNWKSKHLKSIFFSYRKAPRFEACYPKLEALYNLDFERLSDLCFHHLEFWLKELRIRTKIERSSTLGIETRKSQLILDLCRHYGADHYLSGSLGRDYLEEKDFRENKIEITFQAFVDAPYQQLYGTFIPNLSILDRWMNEDPARIFAAPSHE